MLQGIMPSAARMIEVHVDLSGYSESFNEWLKTLGFEDDPFTVFHPVGYAHHMTGRLWSGIQDVSATLKKLQNLSHEIAYKGFSENLPLYIEVELVYGITRFEAEPEVFAKILDRSNFFHTNRFGDSKADIHVEFPFGKITDKVRQYFLEKLFYWVATPETKHFPAEEIATLQTDSWSAAKGVYGELASNRFPFCKAVHLEQKVFMLASHTSTVMPETIQVSHYPSDGPIWS